MSASQLQRRRGLDAKVQAEIGKDRSGRRGVDRHAESTIDRQRTRGSTGHNEKSRKQGLTLSIRLTGDCRDRGGVVMSARNRHMANVSLGNRGRIVMAGRCGLGDIRRLTCLASHSALIQQHRRDGDGQGQTEGEERSRHDTYLAAAAGPGLANRESSIAELTVTGSSWNTTIFCLGPFTVHFNGILTPLITV